VVRLVGVRGFAFADPWLGDGRARLSAFDDVQIVLLQQWHTLSDPGAEEAVRDRLSFRRFCGLPLEVETPDYASIWRFRQAIDKLGLSTKLLAKVNRQLDALGFVIKRGTAHRRDHHRRGGALDVRGGVNPRDPDAHFTLAFPVSTKGSSRQTCDLGCLRRRCRRQAR
jgi:transposase, IS5 family